MLTRQVRAWLGVASRMEFTAVTVLCPTGGVMIVPIEGFARRIEAVTA